MEILDTIHAFWAYFYEHPVRCFLIVFAVILAFSLLAGGLVVTIVLILTVTSGYGISRKNKKERKENDDRR